MFYDIGGFNPLFCVDTSTQLRLFEPPFPHAGGITDHKPHSRLQTAVLRKKKRLSCTYLVNTKLSSHGRLQKTGHGIHVSIGQVLRQRRQESFFRK